MTHDEKFDIWFALWTVEQEADNWLRFGGDPRTTLDHLHDVAHAAREICERAR